MQYFQNQMGLKRGQKPNEATWAEGKLNRPCGEVEAGAPTAMGGKKGLL